MIETRKSIFSFPKFSVFPVGPILTPFCYELLFESRCAAFFQFTGEVTHLYIQEVSSPLYAGDECAAHHSLLRSCSTLSFSGQFRIDTDQRVKPGPNDCRAVLEQYKNKCLYVLETCATFICQINFFSSHFFEVCETDIRVKKRYKFDAVGQSLCPQKVLAKRPAVCLGCWCSSFCFYLKKQ